MTRYDAYVLRLWRSTGKDGPQWRGRLDHLGHGDSVQFSDLDALLQFLGNVAGHESAHRDLTDEQVKGAGE